MNAWIESLQSASADVVRRAHLSLVSVLHSGRGIGSGVLWAPGWVVTNAHVAARGRLSVRLADGSEAKAHRSGRESRLDLAVLEIESNSGNPAVVGDSDELRTGEWVMAVGNPWGVPGAATAGIVIGRSGPMLALGLHLRPGHSGGAVVNSRGEVVGINSMMNGPDVGLAIPSASVRAFMVNSGFGRVAGGMARAA